MKATLDLSASLHGWVCSNCKQLYDAVWRPVDTKDAWNPPSMFSKWPTDKPTFNYCPMCGVSYKGDLSDGKKTCQG